MNLLQHINFDEIDQVLKNKSLADKDLPLPIFRQASFDKGITLGEDTTLPLKAFTNFQIRHFELNQPALQQLPSDAVVKKLLSPPQNQSWIAYTSENKIDVNNPSALKNIGITFDFDKSLIFNTYKLHQNTTSVSQALLKDAQSFVMLISKQQVLENLEIGEAVSMQVCGKLEIDASVSFSDVFNGNLGNLLNLLAPNQSLSLQMNAGVTADFAVSVKDEFSLVIVKIKEDSFRVSLKKAVNQSLNMSLEAGIEARLQNPAMLTKAITPMIEGIFNLPEEKLNQLQEKINLKEILGEGEQKLITMLINRLGLSQGIDVAQLPSQIEAKKKSILAKVIAIAETRVKASFSFEYQLIKTEDAFLQAVFTKQALSDNYTNLVLFRLPDLLTNIAANPSVNVENYLNETSIKKKVAWGFGLDFGKWGRLASKDTESSAWTIRENIAQKKQVSFVGTRLYESKIIKNGEKWGVTFNASMPEYSATPIPQTQEFQYKLQVLLEQVENKSNAEEIEQMVDLAVLWGIVNEEETEKYVQDLKSKLGTARGTTYSFQVNIGHEAFSKMLSKLAEMNKVLLAKSLAGGMDYLQDYDARKSVSKRLEFYTGLWIQYINSKGAQSNWNAIAKEALLSKDVTLANQEGQNAVGTSSSFGSLIKMNPQTAEQITSFFEGIALLKRGYEGKLPYNQIIKKSFEQMQAFWTQSHHIRALGFYLVEIAKKEDINVFKDLGRILTIRYQIGNEQKVMQITQS